MRAALRRPQPNYDRLMELVNNPPNPQPSWRWAVAPAVGLAAIVVISLVLFNNRPEAEAPAELPEVVINFQQQPAAPAAPVIQVALLDIVGATRGPRGYYPPTTPSRVAQSGSVPIQPQHPIRRLAQPMAPHRQRPRLQIFTINPPANFNSSQS